MGHVTAAEGEEIRKGKKWHDPRLKVAQEMERIYKQVMPEGERLLDRESSLGKSACDAYCKKPCTATHQGYVTTLYRRRSRFPTNHKTYISLNRKLQGSAADLMKVKLAELHRQRTWTGLLMRLTVHDQVGGDRQQPETLERVREIFERVVD